MNLSLRLAAVKNMVVPAGVVYDIGCDHGYVSIELALSRGAGKVYACDVNEGPLKAAALNIEAAGLSDVIETRLSDGLHNIDNADAPDAIVIAGMGGRLMSRILTEGKETVMKASQLVLQPQSEIFLVRKWLRDNGFSIYREQSVLDSEKYYFVIDARKSSDETAGGCNVSDADLQEIYDNYSFYLIDKKDSLLKEYLKRNLANNLRYLEGIELSRQEPLLRENRLIKRALELMGQ